MTGRRYRWADDRDGWPVLEVGARYRALRGPGYEILAVTGRESGGHRYSVLCGSDRFDKQDHALLSLLRHPILEVSASNQLALL